MFSIHEFAVVGILPAIAAVIGLVAWSGEPLTLPLALLFPAVWAFAPSRLIAAFVSAAYFLAASRGLPQGAANFFGSSLALGILLWVMAASAFVLVWGGLWTVQAGWVRALRCAAAAILMSVPPFGIVGWAHPLTAAGILFPGWRWLGLATSIILMLSMTTRRWPLAAAVVSALWMLSAVTWTPPRAPLMWHGIDLQLGARLGRQADLDQQRLLIGKVQTARTATVHNVVLPESALGLWTPTTSRLWIDNLQGAETEVLAGAAVVDHDGYDNVIVGIFDGNGQVLYRERMPVPLSMWQPWRGWFGDGGGARAGFFANPVIEVNGLRVAPLICYEQLLVWPVLQSMVYAPDLVVAIGNDWWTSGTSVLSIQRVSAEAWASLFGLPLVLSFNS